MKLLILDRDGVINEDSDSFIKSEEEWIPIPGSIEAIARLSKGGYHVYIATNQSGLGRGLFDLDSLEAMHSKLNRLLAECGGEVKGIFFCPHTPEDHCKCRKPRPGLLEQIQAHAGIPVRGAPIIGDSLRDLEAGVAMGCKPILVKTGKGEKTLRALQASSNRITEKLPVYESLAEAATAILEAPQ